MNRLKKRQKEALLQWVAEGLQVDEINQRAAKFKPKFSVSSRVVTHYRKTRQIELDKLKEAGELDALKSGLALKDKRVEVLQKLADRMVTDLLPAELKDSLLWVTQAKTVANEKYTYLEFNKAEVDALRGTLDDIAAEVGERVKKTDVTSGGEKLNMLTPEQVIEKVNNLLNIARERKNKNAA